MKKLILLILFLTAGLTWGQVNISDGNPITQNFTSLGTSATGTLPTGWKCDYNTSTVRMVGDYSTATNKTQQRGGNSMSTSAPAGIYNFGAGDPATSTDRAIGGLSKSSDYKSINAYLLLKNTDAKSITNLTISYNVEKYRNGTNAAGFSIQLYYSTNGSTWISAGSDFATSFAADGDNNGFSSAPGSTVSVSNELLQEIASGSNFYLAWNYSVTSGSTTSNAQALGIDDVSITATFAAAGLNPPDLTADASANTVDNNIDITFTPNSTWEAAITSVKIGGTALATEDYTISSGNIQLKPSNHNALLTTSGTKAVTVEATGYNTASLTQVINVGVPTANSTATISEPLVTNSTRTVTCTAKDQYNNLVSGYIFKKDVSVTAKNNTTIESYTIDTTPYNSTATGEDVSTATNASGVVTFNVTIPATVDANDGVSVQVKLANGTTSIGSAFAYLKQAPQVTLTCADPGTLDFEATSTNNVIYRIDLATINDVATLTEVSTITDGNYLEGDIATNGFKLWFSADNTFSSSSDTQLGTCASISTGSGDILTFSSISRSIPVGNSYLFITVDLSSSAVAGHNISIPVTSSGDVDLTFSPDVTFGTGSYTTGNTHSFVAGTDLLVENFNYTVGTNLTANSWSAHSAAGTNPITVTNGLSYSDYSGSNIGKAALLANSGEDVNRTFAERTSGIIYASFLVKVNVVQPVYFLHFALNGSSFVARVTIRSATGGYNLGIGSTSSTIYGSTLLTTGTTYLVIVKYDITNAGACSLWVKSSGVPENEGAAGVPEAVLSTSPLLDINQICLRQDNASQDIVVDGIRVGTTWGNAPLPVELSSFIATTAKNGVVLNWATATEINNNRFEIERKIAENNWENIGTVNGHGNSNSVKDYTYTDNNLTTAGTYSYRLKQVDNDGQFTYSNIVEVNVEAPKEFGLVQNYPNPFNPETTISYSIPQSSAVKLIVFNALGQEVMTLVNGYFEAGNHSVKFNASNLPSGVYFYQMQAGNFTSVKKMILTK